MKHFTAVVEISKRGNMSGDEVDTIMDRLQSYHPSLSVSPHGYRSARFTVPADDFAQAVQSAALIGRHAFDDVELVRVEVMSEAEAELREGSLEVPDLVGVTEAAELLRVSPQRVRQMIDEGKLAAHRIGERSFALVRNEVAARAATEQPT